MRSNSSPIVASLSQFRVVHEDWNDSVRQFILIKSAKLCALHFVFFATCHVGDWSKKIGD